jgi:hypothetical protein
MAGEGTRSGSPGGPPPGDDAGGGGSAEARPPLGARTVYGRDLHLKQEIEAEMRKAGAATDLGRPRGPARGDTVKLATTDAAPLAPPPSTGQAPTRRRPPAQSLGAQRDRGPVPSHTGKSRFPTLARLFGRWNTRGDLVPREHEEDWSPDADTMVLPRDSYLKPIIMVVAVGAISFLAVSSLLKLRNPPRPRPEPAAALEPPAPAAVPSPSPAAAPSSAAAPSPAAAAVPSPSPAAVPSPPPSPSQAAVPAPATAPTPAATTPNPPRRRAAATSGRAPRRGPANDPDSPLPLRF